MLDEHAHAERRAEEIVWRLSGGPAEEIAWRSRSLGEPSEHRYREEIALEIAAEGIPCGCPIDPSRRPYTMEA